MVVQHSAYVPLYVFCNKVRRRAGSMTPLRGLRRSTPYSLPFVQECLIQSDPVQTYDGPTFKPRQYRSNTTPSVDPPHFYQSSSLSSCRRKTLGMETKADNQLPSSATVPKIANSLGLRVAQQIDDVRASPLYLGQRILCHARDHHLETQNQNSFECLALVQHDMATTRSTMKHGTANEKFSLCLRQPKHSFFSDVDDDWNICLSNTKHMADVMTGKDGLNDHLFCMDGRGLRCKVDNEIGKRKGSLFHLEHVPSNSLSYFTVQETFKLTTNRESKSVSRTFQSC